MINRILIRIKVIQLLYSFLLTENRFYLESTPSDPTKEKRFAFNLYLDTLLLFYRLSQELSKGASKKRLDKSSFILKISEDDELKKVLPRLNSTDWIFNPLTDYLKQKIEESYIFREYKKNPENNNDKFWEELFNTLIISDSKYNELLMALPNYSLRGVERMKGMLDSTFKAFYTTKDNISDSLKVLEKSMAKARELYMRLLLLPVALTTLQEQQLDENRHKFIKSSEDINPNVKFIENRMVKKLRENKDLIDFEEKEKVSWLMEDRDLMKLLLKEILESDIYKEYMDSEIRDLRQDCELWRNLYKNVILVSQNFLEALENKSLFWNDDLETMGTFALKTFKRLEDENFEESRMVLPMYKDEEDSKFGEILFSSVLKNKDYYRVTINSVLLTDKWESERLAFMDVVILMTAIAEIITFPKIPLLVSINEYIEIAKSYSSHKSGGFINGILRSVIEKLRTEGIINK